MKINISFDDNNYEELSRANDMINKLFIKVTEQKVRREEEIKSINKAFTGIPKISGQITQSDPFPNKII